MKPHQSLTCLNANPEDPETFASEVETVCELYSQALELHQAGVHLLSTDEKTGIQALERSGAALPMQPGLFERREFEYIRHGTLCLIANMEVATGQVITPSIGQTRTEADFFAHIQQTVLVDPTAEWIFITDQLNTHQSESLVRWVAEVCELDRQSTRRGTPGCKWRLRLDLGVKGESGILQSMPTFVSVFTRPDSSHSICLYTQTHFLVESDRVVV